MDSEDGFLCSTCGKWHPHPPDCGYQRPDDLLQLTADHRALCFETDDACVIVPPRHEGQAAQQAHGPRRFYLRGLLYALLTDRPGESFAWGLWVQVDAAGYDRARELWNQDGSGEPPLPGRIANEIAGYAGTFGLAVLLRLGDERSRPSIEITDRGHSLWQIQRNGLTAHAAFEYVQYLSTI